MTRYLENRGPVIRGEGMIYGPDGTSAGCTYWLQPQERVQDLGPESKRVPVGFFECQHRIQAQADQVTWEWLQNGSQLELELEDGRRLSVFAKRQKGMESVEFDLSGAGIKELAESSSPGEAPTT